MFTDRMYGGPVALQSLLATNNQSDTEPRYFYDQMQDQNDRPRWLEHYFFSRPQFGNLGVPDYATQAGEDVATLPLYMSRNGSDFVQSILRTLHESEHDPEEEIMDGRRISLATSSPILAV